MGLIAKLDNFLDDMIGSAQDAYDRREEKKKKIAKPKVKTKTRIEIDDEGLKIYKEPVEPTVSEDEKVSRREKRQAMKQLREMSK